MSTRGFGTHLVEQQDGRAVMINHHPTADGGWVATHEDITEQRLTEARVRHLARHDALTDLPNRFVFREEMDKAESRIKRGEMIAVLCIDLDHFKAVNDTLGHAVGDAVLIEVAARLRSAAREGDVVARLGGDEFALLAGTLDGPQAAATIADRIVKSMSLPIIVDDHQVMIGASVGIAIAPHDGVDGETLLKKADLALYRAKSEGRGTYHFFEMGMDEALQRRRTLEQGLKLALSRGEFRLVYQPLLSLPDNRIVLLRGAAALGSSRARRGPAARVHPPRRGDRRHRRHRRMGAARGLQGCRDLARRMSASRSTSRPSSSRTARSSTR